MSIGKEVEKMYREDAETQKKKQKTKKSGKLATLIVLILIIVLAILLAKVLGLFGGDGLGFGKSGSDDTGNGSTSDMSTVVSDSSEDESSEEEDNRIYDDIKVSGSTYLYKGSEISLEELVDTFSMEKMNKDVVARIGDDNATQNTMEQLTNAFDDMGREYVIESMGDAPVSDGSSDVSAADSVG